MSRVKKTATKKAPPKKLKENELTFPEYIKNDYMKDFIR